MNIRRLVTANCRFLPILSLVAGLTSACRQEDEMAPEGTQQAALVEQLVGDYRVEGTYGTSPVEPVTLSVQKGDNNTLVISGARTASEPISDFAIADWFVGYQDSTDPQEYIIFSEAVGPHQGTVSLAFPDAELAVSVEILPGNSLSTRLLSLSGNKSEYLIG